MHLLLLILRLLLDLLTPAGRRGLSLAARADGRVEQLPAESAPREWRPRRPRPTAKRAGGAPAVRAPGEADASAEAPPG